MFANRIFFAIPALAAAIFIAGCQANSGPAPSASAPATKALVATTGNGTTTVFIPVAGTHYVSALSSSPAPACPDCEAAAVKYFETGELVAVCPTCHATRTPLAGHN